jgi:hypothetical protein
MIALIMKIANNKFSIFTVFLKILYYNKVIKNIYTVYLLISIILNFVLYNNTLKFILIFYFSFYKKINFYILLPQ